MSWIDTATGIGAVGSTVTGAVALWLAADAARLGRRALEAQRQGNLDALRIEYGPRPRVLKAWAQGPKPLVVFCIADAGSSSMSGELLNVRVVDQDGRDVASPVYPWRMCRVPTTFTDDPDMTNDALPIFLPRSADGLSVAAAFDFSDMDRLTTPAAWNPLTAEKGRCLREGYSLQVSYRDTFGTHTESIPAPAFTFNPEQDGS